MKNYTRQDDNKRRPNFPIANTNAVLRQHAQAAILGVRTAKSVRYFRFCRLQSAYIEISQSEVSKIYEWVPYINLMLLLKLERATRFERATLTLARLCSTPELRPRLQLRERLLRKDAAVSRLIKRGRAFPCCGAALPQRHPTPAKAEKAGH